MWEQSEPSLGRLGKEDAVRDTQGKCWHRFKHGKASCATRATGLGRTDVEAQRWENTGHTLWKPMERGPDGQGDTLDLDHGKVSGRGCDSTAAE